MPARLETCEHALQYRARQKSVHAKLLPSSNDKLRKSQQVEQDLRSVLARDPTDERTYVILGTFLLRQRRIDEARAVYEEGCAVSEGKNAFIWTAMANLERKVQWLIMYEVEFVAAAVAKPPYLNILLRTLTLAAMYSAECSAT